MKECAWIKCPCSDVDKDVLFEVCSWICVRQSVCACILVCVK